MPQPRRTPEGKYYSTNYRDPGMRLLLPPSTTGEQTPLYYVVYPK